MSMEADLRRERTKGGMGVSIDEISTVASLAVAAPAGIYVTAANTKPTLRRILPPLVGAKDPGFLASLETITVCLNPSSLRK